MVKGLISKIFEKPWSDPKRGAIILYSIKLDGDANYYSTGDKKPSVKAGDYVELDPFKNAKGYWNVKLEGIKIIPREATETSGPAVQATTRNSNMGMTKDDYWNRKEARDLENDRARNVGASRNTAISLVDILLRQEALKVPAKLSDKADAIYKYVEEYAAKMRGEPTAAPVAAPEVAAPAQADNWE